MRRITEDQLIEDEAAVGQHLDFENDLAVAVVKGAIDGQAPGRIAGVDDAVVGDLAVHHAVAA